jgi:DDE family transposase
VGDAESRPIRLSFNPQLRVEFRGATVTSDAGLLLPRELDERLGLSPLIERHLTDPRTGRNCQFPLADVFRQSIYSLLAGYEDTNDAQRLAEDPTFRCWRRGSPRHERRAHVHAALVRDGGPRRGAKLPRAHSPEPGTRSASRDALALATGDPRHRQLREPCSWDARAVHVQRPLRVRLLPPALRLNPHFRFEDWTHRAIIAQRPQKMRASRVPRWCGGHHPVGDAKSSPVRLYVQPSTARRIPRCHGHVRCGSLASARTR